MKAIIIDDEELCMEIEAEVIKNIGIFDEVISFHKVDEFIEYSAENPVDVAFMDIIMDEADGISLAMEFKRMQPDCKIIFVSGSRDYALEAFQVYASGYLLKPLTEYDVINVLANVGIGR